MEKINIDSIFDKIDKETTENRVVVEKTNLLSGNSVIVDKNYFGMKDTIVNNQSQLGLVFEGDQFTSKLVKQIKNEKSWMNMDTIKWHNFVDHFHGENQKKIRNY